MTRCFVVALFVLGLVACGGKKTSEHHAAVDAYVNKDMLASIGVLWTGKRPLDTIKATSLEEARGWFTPPGGLDQIVIPRMTQFLDTAAKVTPPEVMAASHATIIEIATSYRDVATQMIAAAEADDKAKFEAAHAKLMETTESYLAWQRKLDAALQDHGVKLQDVPKPAPLPGK